MPLGHKLLHGLIQSHSISFERITARVIVWDIFAEKKLPALFISCQQIIVVSCSLACTSNESINLSIYISPHLSLFLRGLFDLNFSTLCCKWSQFLWKDVWSSLFYVSLSATPPPPPCPGLPRCQAVWCSGIDNLFELELCGGRASNSKSPYLVSVSVEPISQKPD